MIRTEDEILYGGARGGGKTDAGMAWLTYWIDNTKYRALVIRRNADDLKDWIDRARQMYRPMRAVFIGQPVEIRFPSGAIIRTGHLRDENAYTKYQGHEYPKMLIEELTHIPRESDYEKLLGSCRSTVPGIKPQLFATTNPDGDGHEWVKERFDCEIPDMIPREKKDKATGIIARTIFIPAKVEDNPHLVKADPRYVAYLNSIKDPVLRRQWREGSWEEPKIRGAYYADWIREAYREKRVTNVPIEKDFPVHTFWDLGKGDRNPVWFAQFIGSEIRLVDYYEPDSIGLVNYIREIKDKGYVLGEHFAPHDIKVREYTSGKSRKEIAESLGIDFQVVPKLSIDDGIEAVKTIFNRCVFDKVKCKDGLLALKHYKKEYDEKRSDYKNVPYHNWASHGADAFRYMAVSYAMITGEPIDKKPSEFKKVRSKEFGSNIGGQRSRFNY